MLLAVKEGRPQVGDAAKIVVSPQNISPAMRVMADMARF
jgi:hypothetical protein